MGNSWIIYFLTKIDNWNEKRKIAKENNSYIVNVLTVKKKDLHRLKEELKFLQGKALLKNVIFTKSPSSINEMWSSLNSEKRTILIECINEINNFSDFCNEYNSEFKRLESIFNNAGASITTWKVGHNKIPAFKKLDKSYETFQNKTRELYNKCDHLLKSITKTIKQFNLKI